MKCGVKRSGKVLRMAAVLLTAAGVGVVSGSIHVEAEEVLENTSIAYEEVECVGDGDHSMTWSIENGTLTVSGTGEIYDYEWYDRKSEIKRAVINVTGVTDVYRLFSGYTNLEEVDLRGLDASQVTDMSCMFYDCSSLRSLNLGDLDTGNVTDLRSMFDGCSSLTNLDLSSLDTGNVTDMSCMFYGCSSLTNLNLSSFDTGSVTDMRSMFDGCSSLANLALSSFDTGSVTNMSYMFYGCGSLTNLDLSSFNTANVTDMYRMFNNCHQLTEIKFGNRFDTSNVTDMFGMFYDCYALKTMDISGFDTSSVTNIGLMFCGCNSLTSLDISHFDFSSLENEDGDYGLDGIMIFGSSLATVKVPANLPQEIELPITELGYDPKEGVEYNYVWKDENQKVCVNAAAHLSVPMTYIRTKEPIDDSKQSQIQESKPSQTQSDSTQKPLAKGTVIHLSSGKYKVSGTKTVTYTSSTSKTVKSVTIPASIRWQGISYNVTAIGDNAFANCTKLKNVTVGIMVKSIGKNAWKGCKNLKKITIKCVMLNSVGKNALKNIHKKCKIKVPSSKLSKYKKKFKGKGQKSSVKITK